MTARGRYATLYSMNQHSKKTQLIGISGTAGAGKDVVADMLCRLYGAENLSSGDALRAVARFVYRLPANEDPWRDQLFEVATYLRSEVNPATLVKVCILQARALGVTYSIITGMRSMGEADAIKAAGGVLVGVDADPRVRYDRIFSRQRGSDTQKTLEQFLAQDEKENKGAADTGDLRGIRAIIDSADVHIDNDGTMEALEAQVREKLGALLG